MNQLPESFALIPVPPSRIWHTWVLSDHYEAIGSPGSRSRTYLGELVYRAKYHDDRRALDVLLNAIHHCVLQLQRMPQQNALASVTSVAAVPCFPPKSMSLPHEVARVAANALGVPDISSLLTKTRGTNAAKTNPGLHPDAYEVRCRLDGRHVLVVDDLYHTGSTLESVATKLRAAGADHLVGLCVTRVHQGMSQ